MIEINDSELLKLEKINDWAAAQQGTTLDVDRFTKDLEEKVNEAGFTCEVRVYDTEQEGVYAFELEINGRADSVFDPDRQVHEVVNNLLELPGQDAGFIPSKDYLDKLVNEERGKKHRGNPQHHDC